MRQKLIEKSEQWAESHPGCSWEADQAWRAKHPSPMERHGRARTKAMAPLKAKRDAILFDARMGKISADELYEAAKKF